MRLYVFEPKPGIHEVADFCAALEILTSVLPDGFRCEGGWEATLGLLGEWRWFYSHDGRTLLAGITREER